MAQDLLITNLCDQCDLFGLPKQVATVMRTLAVDGPPKVYDLCGRCDAALEPFIQLYQERGREAEPPTPKVKQAASPKASEVAPESPVLPLGMELDDAVYAAFNSYVTNHGEPPNARQLGAVLMDGYGIVNHNRGPLSEEYLQPHLRELQERYRLEWTVHAAPAEELKAPEAPKKAAKQAQKKGDDVVRIRCPLPHPSIGNKPKTIKYVGRGTHADVVHHGLKIWDIAWEDPRDVMKHPCHAHKECQVNNLAFTTETGLRMHISSCNLDRIDVLT